MGQNAEELKRDIAQTRYELGDTLDAIGDRVSPGRIMERKKNKVSEGFRTVKERVMGTASDKSHAVSDKMHGLSDAATGMPDTVKQQAQGAPVAAGAIAFGIGFLVAAAIPPSEKEKELSTQVMDKAEPLKQQLTETGQEMADHLKEPASQAASQVKQAAGDAAQQVKGSASDAASDMKDQTGGSNHTFKDPAAY
jgi:gas vesicle protein